MRNAGWERSKAIAAKNNYDSMYQVTADWKANRIKTEVAPNGYSIVAFGLKVRAPKLLGKETLKGLSGYAMAEFRTLANSWGQSYCGLNLRLANRQDEEVVKVGYRLKILPSNTIYDATYNLVSREDPKYLHWLNNFFSKEMMWKPEEWRDCPVELGGELDLFYPTWATPITFKNNISQDEMMDTIQAGLDEQNKGIHE